MYIQAILKSILVYLKTTQLLIMYRPLVMRMTLETKQLRIDTDGLDRIRICKVCQAGNLELFLHGMVTTHPPKIASFPDSAKSCQSVKSRLKMASSHEIQYHRSLLTCYQEHQHRSALAPTEDGWSEPPPPDCYSSNKQNKNGGGGTRRNT